MNKRIRLYIRGNEVEFTTVPEILYNFKIDDITSPAAIKNSFSKTIDIPGTKKNCRIFDEFHFNDYRTDIGSFDARNKAEFTLYLDSDVFETGYCQLENVKKERHKITYTVRLYGGLGDFFYNLSYSQTANGVDQKMKLSDLDFFTSQSGTEPVDLDFTINKETIAEAWDEIDSASSKWHILNFATAYEGYPGGNFSDDKVLMNLPTVSTTPRRGKRGAVITTGVTQTEDGQEVTYTGIDGYALASLPKHYTANEMREFRSYLLRPVLNVKRTIEAICNPKNNGGYEVTLDPDFFNGSNPYYEDMWMTLKRLSALEYTPATPSTSNTLTISNTYASGTGTTYYGYYEDRLATIGNNPLGRAYDIKVKLNLNIEGATSPTNSLYVSAYSLATHNYVDYGSGIFVQLVAYDALGNAVAGSDECYITTNRGWRHTGSGTSVTSITTVPYFIDRNAFDFRGYGEDYYRSRGSQFTRQSGNKFTWNEPITLSIADVPAGATLKLIITKECITNNTSQYGPKNVFSTTTLPNEPLIYIKQSFQNFSVDVLDATISFKDYDGMGTGSRFTKEQLLNTSFSPAEFLISYAKLYNLFFVKDPVDKKISILSRKNFFKRDEVVDVEKLIDRTSVQITPLSFDNKWYEWNLESDEGEFAEKYRKNYGVDYGSARVDTGYDFNRETYDVLEGNIFRSGVQALERSEAFCYTDDDTISKPWQFDGYNYLLYATTDAKKTYEVTVNASSKIDAFSGYTDGYMYYDLYDKPQLHQSANVGQDGSQILLLRNGNFELKRGTTSLNYYITDDTSEMLLLNGGKPCWLYTNTTADTQGQVIAIKTETVPYFNRYWIYPSSGYILRSLDFAQPEEIYLPKAYYRPDSTLFDLYWRDYIADIYSKDSRVLKAKMLIKGKPTIDWLRRFYYFDGSIWRMTAINDYNVAKGNLTSVEFVRVQDKEKYTSPVLTPEPDITLTYNTYEVGATGATINWAVTVSDGGGWYFEHYPDGMEPTPTSGVGDTVGTWVIPAWTGSTDRTFTMVAMADNSSASATLTQHPAAIEIYRTDGDGVLPATGCTIEMMVESDANWILTSQDSGITSIVPAAGSPTTGTPFIVVIAPNPNEERRSLTVTAATSLRSVAYVMTQEAAAVTPSLQWTNSAVTVGSGNTTTYRSYTSHHIDEGSIYAYAADNWVTCTADTANSRIRIHANSNAYSASRSTTVVVRGLGSDGQWYQDVLTVTQNAGQGTLAVNKNKIEWSYMQISSTTQSWFTVTGYSGDYTIVTDSEEFGVNPTTGTNVTNVSGISYEQNYGFEDKTAHAIIKDAYNTLSVEMVRTAVPHTRPVMTTMLIPAAGATRSFQIANNGFPVYFANVPAWMTLRDGLGNTYNNGEWIWPDFGDRFIFMDIDLNQTGVDRTANIMLKNVLNDAGVYSDGPAYQPIQVTQPSIAVSALDVSKSAITWDYLQQGATYPSIFTVSGTTNNPYTITSNNERFTTNPTSGTGITNVSAITSSNNFTYEDKVGTLTVTDGVTTRQIQLRHYAAPHIEPQYQAISMPATGKSIEFTISLEGNYFVYFYGKPDWLLITDSSGNSYGSTDLIDANEAKERTFYFNATSNVGGSQRTAFLQLKNCYFEPGEGRYEDGPVYYPVQITQIGETGTITWDIDAVNVASGATTTAVTYTYSNIDTSQGTWIAIYDDDMITTPSWVTATNNSASTMATFVIQANTGNTSRHTNIEILAVGANGTTVHNSIVLTQARSDANLVVSPLNLEWIYAQSAYQQRINVTGDTSYTATTNNNNFTISPTTGTGVTSIMATPAGQNNDYSAKTTTVTITDGINTFDVTLTQGAAPHAEPNIKNDVWVLDPPPTGYTTGFTFQPILPGYYSFTFSGQTEWCYFTTTGGTKVGSTRYWTEDFSGVTGPWFNIVIESIPSGTGVRNATMYINTYISDVSEVYLSNSYRIDIQQWE